MRTRKIRISVRLNNQEYQKLKRKTAAAGIKIEPFIRALIAGVDLQPKPPDTYMDLLKELNAIGTNINQIARIANTNRHISPAQITILENLLGEIWRKVKGI